MSDDETRATRLKDVQKSLIIQKPHPVGEFGDRKMKRPGEFYKRYRTIGDLPEDAKAFYELAGKFHNFDVKMVFLILQHQMREFRYKCW
jgi:RNA polymerase I-specific transcription initiation factor RRN7